VSLTAAGLAAVVAGVSPANGANGMSDIEDKVARVAMSECGQRMNFNGADGIIDIEQVPIGNRSVKRWRAIPRREVFHRIEKAIARTHRDRRL